MQFYFQKSIDLCFKEKNGRNPYDGAVSGIRMFQDKAELACEITELEDGSAVEVSGVDLPARGMTLILVWQRLDRRERVDKKTGKWR